MRNIFIILLIIIIAPGAFAQKERKFVREGNGYYARWT